MSGYCARIEPPWCADAWRAMARRAWEAGVPPEDVDWTGEAQQGLLAWPALVDAPRRRTGLAVPVDFMALAEAALCHRDSERHGLLYRILWRIGAGERHLLERATDADVFRARQWEKAVRRGVHKMKAFVRFRAVPGTVDTFVAWFEPEHWIVDRVAPFFLRRFAGMCWSIVTPYRSLHWDGVALHTGPGGQRGDVPAEDAHEDLWKTYYANIFNPARLNTTMMRQEMPQKYWHLLPETQLLPTLVRDAGARVRDMAEREAQPPRRRIPARPPRP